MNYEEFLSKENDSNKENMQQEEKEETNIEQSGRVDDIAIDVQKAVVESLAADKAEQEEKISCLQVENQKLKEEIENLKKNNEEQKRILSNVGDLLAKNTFEKESNVVSLLERSIELADRFPGETHDHVLEAIKYVRNLAEKEGRFRCAQVLESVLVANEPNGTLAKKRIELEKLFNDNQNIINGNVIEELTKLGISFKNGETYMLPKDIIKFVY